MHESTTSPRMSSFIDGLTESVQPVHRRRVSREVMILVAILVVQLAGSMTLIGSSAMAVFTHNMSGSIAKAIMLSGLTLGFAALAFRSFEPTAPRQNKLAIALGGLLLGFGILTLDRNFGGGVVNVLRPASGVNCLTSATSFALPMFIALTIFMRGAAPTQPKMTALFVGIASGSWGVFIYSLQCPFTNIGYLAVWYGGAVAIVTLAAAVILPRIARW